MPHSTVPNRSSLGYYHTITQLKLTPSLLSCARLLSVGKSAFGNALAERWSAFYPNKIVLDGRGVHPDAASAGELMKHVVLHFQPGAQLPASPDALRRAYLEILTERPILVVVDDARDLAQVECLVPPPGSALLVTSRQDIPLEGHPPLRLTQLQGKDAEDILRFYSKLNLSASHAKEIAGLCAGLPLALMLAGSYLGGVPGADASAIAAAYISQLRNSGERLGHLDAAALETGSISVSATLSLSEQSLDTRRQTVWRRLCIFAGCVASTLHICGHRAGRHRPRDGHRLAASFCRRRCF